jgi:hypothetical protein
MSDADDSLPLDEAGPFDKFSVPETCAFIFKKYGADALRELLARPIPHWDGTTLVQSKEDWQDVSAELRGCGLSQVADVVDEFAAAAPEMTDMQFCVYVDTPQNATNRRSWLRAQQQRQAQRAIKREQWTQPPTGPRKPYKVKAKAKPSD